MYAKENKPIIGVKKAKSPRLGGEASINSSIKNEDRIILINNNDKGIQNLNFFILLVILILLTAIIHTKIHPTIWPVVEHGSKNFI